jgi:hypothetical protein
MMAGVFVPVENWILHRHTDWETTFLMKESSDSTMIAMATLLHIVVTLVGYRLSMYILLQFGADALIRTTMLAFTLFFSTQGMFYESLMYPGTYDEFHGGVTRSFWSFFVSQTFVDSYIVFFVFFGPAFYYLCITWNNGCTSEELRCFVRQLAEEITLHGAIIIGGYCALLSLDLLPAGWGLWRLIPISLTHFVPHILLILPFYLCATKERKE